MRQAAFPEARVVVVRRDLLEAELLVVIGADPLGCVDGAALEGRIDVAAGHLLRDDAELLHDLTGDAGDAHLQALQILNRLDLLAEPAAHLGAGIAAGKRIEVVLGHELVHEADAAAVVIPGIELAGIEGERERGRRSEGRVLADIVIGGRMGHLDRPARHRIGRLEGADDLARRERLDLELAFGRRRHELRQEVRAAIDRVERFREARGQAPADFRARLGDRGLGDGACGEACTGRGEKIAAFHKCLLLFRGMSRFLRESR